MEKLFEIASKVSTPLALAGIVVMVLFFTFRSIIRLKIFSKQKEQNTFKVLNKVLNYVFILALISIVLGVTSYIVVSIYKTEGTGNEEVPVIRLDPLFDSTLLDEKPSSGLQQEYSFQLASFSPNSSLSGFHSNSLNIIDIREDFRGGFPVFFFTLINNTNKSLVINRAAANIVSIDQSLGFGNTRLLMPSAIWDVVLPGVEGYYEYKPRKSIIVEGNDAVIIGVRFSQRWSKWKASPFEKVSYTLYFTFKTHVDGIEATSRSISLRGPSNAEFDMFNGPYENCEYFDSASCDSFYRKGELNDWKWDEIMRLRDSIKSDSIKRLQKDST